MSRWSRGRWVLVVVALSLMAGVASALDRASQAASPMATAGEMRDVLREIRIQLNACLTTQDQVELRFQSLTSRTESLRSELDLLESLDSRGVPADLYESYLGLVDEYNASISEWDRQGENLRAYASRCRQLAEAHNARADSLQRFLVDHGIWEEAWLQSDVDTVTHSQ